MVTENTKVRALEALTRNIDRATARRKEALAARPEGSVNTDIHHQYKREVAAALARYERATGTFRR